MKDFTYLSELPNKLGKIQSESDLFQNPILKILHFMILVRLWPIKWVSTGSDATLFPVVPAYQELVSLMLWSDDLSRF